jgi:hypothetical protein
MALRLQRTRTLHGPAERRLDAPARQSQRGAASVHGQRERLHPPVATAIDQHQFLAARVKRLDPDNSHAGQDALRVPRPVERDTGHHGAVGIADFQIQHIAPAVKRQGRSRVGRQAEGGEGDPKERGYPKELACEKAAGTCLSFTSGVVVMAMLPTGIRWLYKLPVRWARTPAGDSHRCQRRAEALHLPPAGSVRGDGEAVVKRKRPTSPFCDAMTGIGPRG